jgi:hypothetical protein
VEHFTALVETDAPGVRVLGRDLSHGGALFLERLEETVGSIRDVSNEARHGVLRASVRDDARSAARTLRWLRPRVSRAEVCDVPARALFRAAPGDDPTLLATVFGKVA